MDHDKLRTASTYLNNLLLARGLLRNGEPVDFVKPSKESRAQIINLVHDLILREDRDKEQREHLADTLRSLRSEETRQNHEIERLVAKKDESARATVQAQAAERAAQTEVKKVEKAMKALQEQTNKLKTSLAQVKTQCTNDVRKRDLELSRLKTHLQGQQRGNKVGMTAPTMTIHRIPDKKAAHNPANHDLRDPKYTLRQETTEFLTQLSQSLSEENDVLIGVIRKALGTIRELLGMSANARRHPDSAVGSMGSDGEIPAKTKSSGEMLQNLPTSYETLEADMDSTLGHLKDLLTSPNFVSIEEVELREEEIARLREGWERMEQRWRDVLRMMEEWRKRMNTGGAINMEDLRRGIGLVSPEQMRHVRDGELPEPEQSLIDSEVSEIKLRDISGDSDSSMMAPVPPKHISPARSTSKRKRDLLEPPTFFDLRPPSTNGSAPVSPPKIPQSGVDALFDEEDESEELEIPQMTVAEKLSAAQEEAEEAAAASKAVYASSTAESRASRKARRMSFGVNGSVDDDTLGKMPSPMAKRTKIRGRPRKRKSTLSPDELEALVNADENGLGEEIPAF